jgi:nicotinate-nucleotide adenylyltransferase
MARYMRVPNAEPGMKIGLLGGSFNPPHEGHLHLAHLALKRAKLDQIWWMITPGNPLKSQDKLAPLEKRIARSHTLIHDRRIIVTALEAGLNTRYTEHTLAVLKQRRPHQKFVWLMGADNLAEFHHWRNWRSIAQMMPMVIVDRPGASLSSISAPAAIALSRYRVDEADAALIGDMKPPAWTLLHGPRSHLSSTELRAQNT